MNAHQPRSQRALALLRSVALLVLCATAGLSQVFANATAWPEPFSADDGRLLASDLSAAPHSEGERARRIVRLSAMTPLHSADGIGSADGRYTLIYRPDGNLVLYGAGGQLWHTNTAGTSPGSVTMQADGNLVVRNSVGRLIWSSGSAGNPSAHLELADDGSLVVRRMDGSTAWQAQTSEQ